MLTIISIHSNDNKIDEKISNSVCSWRGVGECLGSGIVCVSSRVGNGRIGCLTIRANSGIVLHVIWNHKRPHSSSGVVGISNIDENSSEVSSC
jgi:hypothetical protein